MFSITILQNRNENMINLIIIILKNCLYEIIIIRNYYFSKCKNKLNRIKPIVIGISGSYGKTSFKNILYEDSGELFPINKNEVYYNITKKMDNCNFFVDLIDLNKQKM